MSLTGKTAICVWLICELAVAAFAWSADSPPPMLPHPEKIADVDKNFLQDAGEVLAIEISPDGKLLAGGSRDGTVRLWDAAVIEGQWRLDEQDGGVSCLQTSEFVRGMFGTRRGCWATWNAAGEVVRFDDGTLIPDAPDVAGVARGELGLKTPQQRIVLSYPGQNSFPITLYNAGTEPVYWPRVMVAVADAREKESKFAVVLHWPDRAAAVLEPGAQAEFTAVLVPRCDYVNPKGFAEEIDFAATGLNCEPIGFRVAAEFQTPELELGPVVLDTRSDTPGMALTVFNRGQTGLTSREVTVSLAPGAPGTDGQEERLAAIQVDLAAGAARTLPLPLSDALAQRLRESMPDGMWTVSVLQRDPALHRWTSPPLPVELPRVPWLLYWALTLGSIAPVLAGAYAGLFLHPDVRRVSRDPVAVLDTPLARFVAVRRLLGWTRRLPAVLANAEVSRQRMDAVGEFLGTRDAEHCGRLLTEPLGWTARRLETDELDAFFAEVSSDFLLNLERCLFVFPDPRTPIDDWRAALRRCEPNADRMVTIVISTDAAHRERL